MSWKMVIFMCFTYIGIMTVFRWFLKPLFDSYRRRLP